MEAVPTAEPAPVFGTALAAVPARNCRLMTRQDKENKMKLTKEDGSLKGWVIAFIWTAIFVGLVFAVSSMINDHCQLADPNSELSKWKAEIEQQREQERKEIMGKYYADPRPVLMGAYQGTEVKLIEIGGHEYIVATAYAGNHSGGSSVSVTHHVGCKSCKKEVNDGTR